MFPNSSIVKKWSKKYIGEELLLIGTHSIKSFVKVMWYGHNGSEPTMIQMYKLSHTRALMSHYLVVVFLQKQVLQKVTGSILPTFCAECKQCKSCFEISPTFLCSI